MKARTVAGDLDRGRSFLQALQQIGWERFGKDADLASLLREMRAKIEREQGAAAPLKAGPGGYYDIDFILLYLRLKSAGVFFEILSTPRRIEIVRELGGLSDAQARFLHDTAVFYRALDHAIRVATGRSSNDIPPAVGIQEAIGELVRRWSPIAPAAQPLAAFVEHVRRSTRAVYRDVFAE
jgi:glutamate-ammonia-ligase adenylyltransferase